MCYKVEERWVYIYKKITTTRLYETSSRYINYTDNDAYWRVDEEMVYSLYVVVAGAIQVACMQQEFIYS